VGGPGSRREYGAVFDSVAEAYDAVRPGYPPALVDRAIERGGLVPGSRVVEVGSGTGKLTELLVARELRVDAVEPGPNMIAAARRRLGDTAAVTFHNGRFEDVDLPAGAFKAVFSATAFHWVDPQVGWAKAASLLENDGLLALLVYTTLRDEETAALDEEFIGVLRKHAPELTGEERMPRELDVILAGAEERRDNVSEVWDWLMSDGRHEMGIPEAAPMFEDTRVDTALRVEEETADELIAHLRTTSFYFRLPPDRREEFEEDDRRIVESRGGSIRRSFATLLMTARKAS
jgi:SAM-dependent methyltransferase